MFLFPYDGKHLPITGFVGINGSGKSALAVTEAIKACMPRKEHRNIFGQLIPARPARKIYSNVPIIPPKGSGIEYVPITSMRQFWDEDAIDEEHPRGQPLMKDGHVLIDEVNAVFPARGTTLLPKEVTLLLQTLRKYQLTFSWTSPSYDHADVDIRRISNSVTTMKPLLRVESKDSIWPETKVSFARQYDLTSYVTDEIDETTPAITDGWIRIKSLMLENYDSWAPVSMIQDHLYCAECGGNLKKETCRWNGDHTKDPKSKHPDHKVRGWDHEVGA